MTLLDRIAALGVEVVIDDEGHYGPAVYSDDWREAHAAGRKPTYVPHPATHSVLELARQVDSSNVQIAGLAGVFKDLVAGSGFELEAPILAHDDFERLESAGLQDRDVGPFLRRMRELADAQPKESRQEE